MRRRKQDYTTQERKNERQFGFLACLGVNAAVFVAWRLLTTSATGEPIAPGATIRVILLALPWAVNVSILALALAFRPHFALGYLVFFAVLIAGSAILGTLFVTACFVSVVTMLILDPLGDAGRFVGLACVLPIAFFGGLYYLGKAFLPEFSRWWSGN